VGRFGTSVGRGSLAELHAASIADPAWFWDAVVEHLGLPFPVPYRDVLDTSAGLPWTTWFDGGRTNLALACVDRWSDATPDADAVVWEGEEGEARTWTFAELRAQADACAVALAERGVGEGDAVGIYLPMLPETVAAVLGVAKLGASFVPVFSGYGAEAVRVRLEDAGTKALVTADAFPRRGNASAVISATAAASSRRTRTASTP